MAPVMNIVLAIGAALLAFSLYLMLRKGTPGSKHDFDDPKEKEKRRVARSPGILALVTDGLFLGASHLPIKGYT